MRARFSVVVAIALLSGAVVTGQQTAASAEQAASRAERAGSAAGQTPEALPSSSTRAVERLRSRIEERWRVVATRDGVVLVPRRGASELAGVEIAGDQILIAGHPVSGAELRERIGADAEAVLALSYLDEQTRRQLFDRPRPGGRAAEATPVTAGPPSEGARIVLRRHGARVRIGSDLVIGEQERVEDAAVAVLGSVTVDGEVGGDVVAVAGGIRLGPHAVVRGTVTSVGGRIEAHPEARVIGGVNEVALTWPDHWGAWSGEPWRLRTWPDRAWWSGVALSFTSVRLGLAGLLGLMVVLLGGSFYRRTHDQVTATPGQAIIVGLGAQIVLAPLFALVCAALLISIIGIPLLALVPIVLLLAAAVWLVGFAAVSERIGQRMLGALTRAEAAPALAFLTGFVAVAGLVWLTRFAWWAGGVGAGAAFVLGTIAALVEGVVWSAGLGALILGWMRGSRPETTAIVPPPLTDPVDGPASL